MSKRQNLHDKPQSSHGALEAPGRGAGRQVERRKSTDPKVPTGTTESSLPALQTAASRQAGHGSNRGLRVENGQSPGGAKEKMGLDRCVLSSLTGLVLYSRHNPAMNRPPVRRRRGWAIFKRPCGTWNHDTLNGYTKRRGNTVHQPTQLCDSPSHLRTGNVE